MFTMDTISTPRASIRMETILLSALIFLIPVLLIPSNVAPFAFTKVTLAVLIAVALLTTFVVRTMRAGSLTVSWSWLSGALLLLPLTYLISAFFSAHRALSFFGYQLETDTFGFVVLGSTLALLIPLVITTRARIVPILVAFLCAGWVVLLFQLIQLFLGTPFPSAILADPSVNLVGSWSDLGIFAGLLSIFALLVVETVPLSVRDRILVIATLVASLVVVVLGALPEVWYVMALTAFALLVYALSQRYFVKSARAAQSGIFSAAVLVVALFFIIMGGGVTTAAQSALHIQAIGVRPSLSGTISVLSHVYQGSPIVGSGPNTFQTEWLKYRPIAVLNSPFWNVNFSAGSGLVPTAVAVGGIVVGLGWLAFLAALMYTLARALISSRSDDRLSFITVIPAVGSLYLAVMLLLSSPGSAMTLLFFIFVGLFVASLRDTPHLKTYTIHFAEAPRVGFAVVLVSLLIAIVGLGALYGTGRMYMSAIYYGKALVAGNTGKLADAGAAIKRAVALAPQDQYYRTATAIDLARLNEIVSGTNADAAAQTAFRDTLASAITNSGAALALDRLRFENWLARAQVYALVVPLKIDGASDNARAALEEARKVGPTSPDVDYRLAQIEAVEGNTKAAEELVMKVLAVKPDYTNAIMLLAQLEIQDGDLGKAIESVKAAVYFEPQNATLLYQLGILLIEAKNYTDAATVFEEALKVDSNFANAKFFLAEAYAFMNRYDDASAIMAALAKDNPGNDTVEAYLTALKAGKNPFKTTTAPVEKATPTIE